MVIERSRGEYLGGRGEGAVKDWRTKGRWIGGFKGDWSRGCVIDAVRIFEVKGLPDLHVCFLPFG